MAEKDLTIKIGVDQKGAEAGFKKLGKNVEAQNKALMAMGKTAGIAFAAVSAGLGFAIKETMEAEKVDKRLEQQLKSMGITSKGLTDNMKKLASQIQNVSTYGDEELKNVMTDLLIVTKDYNAALTHTQTAADLASAKNMDLKQATLALGMAYIGNTARLKQYGIVLAEGVKGSEALAAIQKQFTGASAAAALTLDGQLKQTKNSISDLGESIGMAFLPMITQFVKETNNAVKRLIMWNEATKGGIGEIAKWSLGISGALMVVGFLVPKIVEFKKAMTLLNLTMKANPIIAVASAVGLLTLALTELGAAQIDKQNKDITEKVNSDNMIKRAEAEIEVRKQTIEIMHKQGKTAGAAIDEETEAIKRQENLIKGLSANKAQGVQGVGKSIAPNVVAPETPIEPAKVKPQFETGLADALRKEGEDVDALWVEMDAKRIEDLNNKYLTEDELQAAYLDIKVNRIAEAQAKEIELATMTAEQVEAIEAEKHAAIVEGLSGMFNNLMSISSVKNKEMFEISKGANIAQTLMDTYTGAQKAFTSLAGINPALGIAAAIAATAAGMTRVHSIMATGYNAKGAADGVFDFRASGNNENLVTTLAPGESIIPKKFTDAIKDGNASIGGSGGAVINIIVQGDVVGTPKDDFYKTSAQRINELIQSGEIPAGQFTGATI